MKTDIEYMTIALELAQKAYDIGEVPVGAVVVWDDGRIVGTGYNLRETSKNALAHAELIAIDQACKTLNGWRLYKATLYVTLEPCPMCAGAIVNSRIKRVVYGTEDQKSGSFGSVVNIGNLYNHSPTVDSGILEDECSKILKDFFIQLRQKK